MNKKNNYVKISEVSYGSKIKQSFGAVIIGLILFICSFAILWWNEGRADLSKIAELAQVIDASKIDKEADGKFVSITGKLEVLSEIEDPEFLLPGKYIGLERGVEMYAWVEEKATEEKEKVGGKTEVITKFNYVKEWTNNPLQASSFEYPEGHMNPELPYKDQRWYAEEAKVSVYRFSPRTISLPSFEDFELNDKMLRLPNTESGFLPIKREGNYLYIGEGNLKQPELGDVRIRYKALIAGKIVTLFGKLNKDYVEAYVHKGKEKFYKLMNGTRDESIYNLRTQHKMIGWIFRIIGFFMMWIGMGMFFAPIHALLKVIPILSNASKTIVNLLLFPVALVLTLITILISMIMHSVIALIVVIVVVIGVVVLLLKRKKIVVEK